jgi:hypothetical protein
LIEGSRVQVLGYGLSESHAVTARPTVLTGRRANYAREEVPRVLNPPGPPFLRTTTVFSHWFSHRFLPQLLAAHPIRLEVGRLGRLQEEVGSGPLPLWGTKGVPQHWHRLTVDTDCLTHTHANPSARSRSCTTTNHSPPLLRPVQAT